jgi:UDP-3-O-[3-hydroxymyristoyl] glucosamine N-acyltransferase
MVIDLKTLAAKVGGRLDGPSDLPLRGAAAIRDAAEGDVTFVAKPKYLPDLQQTLASAVILSEGVHCRLPAIRVVDPYLSFVKALHIFARPRSELFAEGVHVTACVDSSATLGEEVRIGPFAVVDAGCRIGDRSYVGAGSVLMRDVTVGRECILYPNVTIREECEIGDRVVLHPGVVIGSDGFGFAKHEGSYRKIPQIGKVVLEDDVEVGANSCIDRATTGRTIVAAGTKLDNLVQIGHNVSVGHNSVISAQSGVSGSCQLGADVIIAGQVGIADHLEIGSGARIGAKSGVSNHVPAGGVVSGIPARDHRSWRRLQAHIGRLPRYAEELAELRQRLEELENR